VSFLNQIIPAPKFPYLFPNQLLTKTLHRFPRTAVSEYVSNVFRDVTGLLQIT
jgi:hypothetical protein